MDQNALTDRQRRNLVKRAQRGDGTAFGALVRDCSDALYRVCLGATGGREADAAEAVQNALAAAWRGLESLREPRFFKTWLIRICLNECTDIVRRRREADLLDTQVESLADPALHPAAALEADAGFRELVQMAGADNGAAIALYYGEGYRTDEIAEILGISPAAVRQRLSRGRRAIANALAAGEPDATASQPTPRPRSAQPPLAPGARAPGTTREHAQLPRHSIS